MVLQSTNQPSASMAILVVADFFPWPPLNGGLLRLATTIDALCELGTVDLFSFADQRQKDQTVPSDVVIRRLTTAAYPAIDRSGRWRASWLVHRGVPLEVALRQADHSGRRQFNEWVDGPYDLIWFRTPMTFAWLGRPRLGPTIVDLDGLVDEAEKERSALMRTTTSVHFADRRVHGWLAGLQARLNARDWESFQRSVAAGVDKVVLCSEEEVRRSRIPNAELVINTYPRPRTPVGRSSPGDPPVVLFQGTFDYGPNADGAEWFVREVVPRLGERVPGTRVRLVGKPSPAVERLHDPPAVSVVGVVPSMGPELAGADLAIAPIRYGSGTRLKILESFANRVPVVSTSLGAAGLAAQDKVHVLIADDTIQFAKACETILTNLDLRACLVDQAQQLYLARYETAMARQQIHSIVNEVSKNGGDPR